MKTFRGGHFNYWNKRLRTPDNFAIEFDFRALSPAPLHMLMFCAAGMQGESVFDSRLPKRYGKAVESCTVSLCTGCLTYIPCEVQPICGELRDVCWR